MLHSFIHPFASPIYLNVFMFVRIIRDPASPTEEVSIRFFNESLQITFPNNVLASSETSQRVARKRGAGWAELICI